CLELALGFYLLCQGDIFAPPPLLSAPSAKALVPNRTAVAMTSVFFIRILLWNGHTTTRWVADCSTSCSRRDAGNLRSAARRLLQIQLLVVSKNAVLVEGDTPVAGEISLDVRPRGHGMAEAHQDGASRPHARHAL